MLRRWSAERAALVAVAGQFSWPAAGSFMTAPGQDLTSADNEHRLKDRRLCCRGVTILSPLGHASNLHFAAWFLKTLREIQAPPRPPSTNNVAASRINGIAFASDDDDASVTAVDVPL